MPKAVEQPNIALIRADQLAPHFIGAYGNAEVKTPYVNVVEPENVLFSFTYSVVGQLEEWKRYLRDLDCKQRLSIKRFDALGGTKSVSEVESIGGPDVWRVPQDLPKKAELEGFQVIFLAEDSKDHCYLRLLRT